MADERVRSNEHLPPKTRQASEGLQAVLRAAGALAEVAAPAGRGAGKELIDREVEELRVRIRQLTTGTESLDQQLRSPYRLLVVGPSQVGKSTLINVLAGQPVLATAGIGDAKTLKETVLTFSSEGDRRLRVRYISRQEAQQRRFTLETYARKQPDLKGAFVKPWNTKESAAAGVEDDAPDLSGEAASDEAVAAQRELDRRYGTLVMQIKTLIYPEVRDPKKRAALRDADRDSLDAATLADWIDGWCMLLGHEPVAGDRYGGLWRPRLADAAERLGSTAEVLESEVGPKPFRDAVEQHTATGLAFLVDRVELALPSEDLEQMDVEDLPGVGNYQDPAADVARDVLAKAMRERDLDGVLVVAAQNGLDQNTANLVEESAVLRRVLEGQTDLAVAVTHIDQIARQLAQDMEDQGTDEHEFPSNDEILRIASERASAPQVRRLKELLQRQVADVEEPERSARVGAVLERTRVVGVEASAAEAFRFNLRRKIEGAFARSYEGTGVPDLLSHFKDKAQTRHSERLGRVIDQTERIRGAISTDLARIARDHDIAEAVQVAAAAREGYLRALKESQLPLSNSWATTRERASTRLSHGIPAQLPITQLKAQKEASKRKRAVIRGCEQAGSNGTLIHWATMKAALRWGGTWSGAHCLDLPGELGGALMPALLAGWRQVTHEVENLLDAYRTGAEALLTSLDQTAAHAARSAGLQPNDAAIADAKAQLKNNLEAAVTLLNAHVDQLNERVPQRLRQVLKSHFESECERVLRENPHDHRPGYTRRLLNGYDEIGEEAIEKGAVDGVKVLRSSLDTLRQQIQTTLFEQDPVSFAYRRLIAGIHDTAEAPEVVEARAALVTWAKANLSWADNTAGNG
jgi:GTP-binding protein EngB required for normal cell division